MMMNYSALLGCLSHRKQVVTKPTPVNAVMKMFCWLYPSEKARLTCIRCSSVRVCISERDSKTAAASAGSISSLSLGLT